MVEETKKIELADISERDIQDFLNQQDQLIKLTADIGASVDLELDEFENYDEVEARLSVDQILDKLTGWHQSR